MQPHRAWLKSALAVPPDPRPLDDPAVAEIDYVPVPEGELRVLHAPAVDGAARRPIVMLPGFGATLEGWQDFYGLTESRVDLYVIETLEKRTTRLHSEAPDLGVLRMAEVLQRALDHLGLSGRDFVLFASCWGSTIVLEGLIQGALTAPTVAAYDPMHAMWFPPWFLRHISPRLPAWLIDRLRGPIKDVALRGMDEPTQRQRTEAFIAAADAFRWKTAAEAAADEELFGRLGGIREEVLVFNGSHDKIHDRSLYPRVAREIPRGRFFDMEVDESERERLSAVIALELARVSADEGVPETLAPFEVALRSR